MPRCIHELGFAPRTHEQLYHSDNVEAQIELARTIRPLELFQLSKEHFGPLGPIREETMVFLILESRFSDDNSVGVNDLTTMIDELIKSAIAHRFGRQIPAERIESFCCLVSQLFWLRVLDHEDATAAWAQVAFWPFVITLAKGLLKRDRFERGIFSSLESDPSTHSVYELAASEPISVYDSILIDELLQVLTPIQRRAFVLRNYQEFSLEEIGRVLNRSQRAVRNILNACEKRLQPYLT
jgi:hypothetical protein